MAYIRRMTHELNTDSLAAMDSCYWQAPHTCFHLSLPQARCSTSRERAKSYLSLYEMLVAGTENAFRKYFIWKYQLNVQSFGRPVLCMAFNPRTLRNCKPHRLRQFHARLSMTYTCRQMPFAVTCCPYSGFSSKNSKTIQIQVQSQTISVSSTEQVEQNHYSIMLITRITLIVIH